MRMVSSLRTGRGSPGRIIATTAVAVMLVALGAVWVTRNAITSDFHLTHGSVVEERGQTASGTTRAMVAWTDQDGVDRRRLMELDAVDGEAGTVPLWVPNDDPVVPVIRPHPAPFWQSTVTWVAMLGGLVVGGILGMHVAGWGFITDRAKTAEELQESRGFYWRS
jgi:hypothetical protein